MSGRRGRQDIEQLRCYTCSLSLLYVPSMKGEL